MFFKKRVTESPCSTLLNVMEQTPIEHPGCAKPLVGAVGYTVMTGRCLYLPGTHSPQASPPGRAAG